MSWRDPVLNAAETDVRAAVDGLKSMLLAIERSGERVARYAHNVERMMNVPQQATALLAVLMLRGPQTAGELRMNCERLHCFADIHDAGRRATPSRKPRGGCGASNQACSSNQAAGMIFPYTAAGSTLRILDGYGLRGEWPARPTLAS